jgi:hypothetical protein
MGRDLQPPIGNRLPQPLSDVDSGAAGRGGECAESGEEISGGGVLSACQTGSGRATGDGVDGLSRAILIGGASTLVMTLHEVAEDAALELAYQFLTHWRTGDTPATAFRRAQLELAEQHPDDPALWIPFALFGLGA